MSSIKKTSFLNERGAASLLFSLIMMIVISLIVLSFAQLARRGQREVLDSQLSNQAYYAAESGVNDVIQAISNLQKRSIPLDNPGCGASTAYSDYLKYKLSPTDNSVGYTCVSVNPNPGDEYLTDLQTNVSKILTISPTTSVLGDMTIAWTPTQGKTAATASDIATCPSVGNGADFSAASDWQCPYGVMRFDLVPTSGAALTRGGLIASTLTVFAVPTRNGDSGSSTVSYSGNTQQGLRVNADCSSTPGTCKVKINNLPAASTYSMRLMPKYASAASLRLNATLVSGGSANFKDGQAIVDVTGRAQNVLRRIQVRIPLTGSTSGYADYAIASQNSICKRFQVAFDGQTVRHDDPTCLSFE